TLRRLRLTSKHLEFLVTPVLLNKLVICTAGLKATPFRRCEEIEATVATGRGFVFRGVKTLSLKLLLPPDDPLPWFTMLNALVPQLNRLQTLWWLHELNSGGYPPQELEKLTQSFARLPNLLSLDLKLPKGLKNPCMEFPVQPMGHPNLHLLRVEWTSEQWPTPDTLSQFSSILTGSQNLEYFSFTLARGKDIGLAMFREMFRGVSEISAPLQIKSLSLTLLNTARIELHRYIPSLRHLEKLEISYYPCPLFHNQTALGEVCQALADEQIFLKHIALDAFIDPAVFNYLAAFHGMDHIFLQPPKRPQAGSEVSFLPQLMDQFFSSV
ncbi:hypothetical protein AN958_01951, partial [Leucoagaricus sp. SymC.cos]